MTTPSSDVLVRPDGVRISVPDFDALAAASPDEDMDRLIAYARAAAEKIETLEKEVERLTIDKASGWYETVTREHSHMSLVEIPALIDGLAKAEADLTRAREEAGALAEFALRVKVYPQGLAGQDPLLGIHRHDVEQLRAAAQSYLDAPKYRSDVTTREQERHQYQSAIDRIDALRDALLVAPTRHSQFCEAMTLNIACDCGVAAWQEHIHSLLSGSTSTETSPAREARCTARKHDKHVEEASNGRSYPCHCRCVPAPETAPQEERS